VELRLERLNPETLHDFLDYFDHRAFLNDEDWAGCYCQAYLNPPGTDPESVFGEGKARQAVCDRVNSGTMDGYLAFDGDRMVAWCAAGNSKLYELLPDAEDTLARIICLNVDPDLRQQGIAGKMIDLVIDDLTARGFAAIEAGPSSDETSQKSFQGTVSMFATRGFEKVMDLPTGQVLMRRYLD
jgi:ribosomal protein S18 acetylase RimI-like enzyme